LSDTRPKAVAENLRVSPQKLNLLAQMIRGKKVDTALADLEFSRKRIAKDVRKCVMSAVANAENNHWPRRQRSRGQGSLRRQEHGDHPVPCPRPRPHEPDREAVLAADRGGEAQEEEAARAEEAE
jgi:hypothetical protein